MIRKFFVTMIAFAFVTVHANAATHNSLKAAFDDLNYSLTVEWNQTDRAFYNQQMEKFASTLRDLQAQGLSNQELIEFTVSQVKDENLAKNLKTAFNMVVINKMNQQQAHEYVTNIMNQSYSRGASWAGEVAVGAVALVILIALGAIVAGKATIEDGCYKIYTCDEDCFGGFCHQECDYRCI